MSRGWVSSPNPLVYPLQNFSAQNYGFLFDYANIVFIFSTFVCTKSIKINRMKKLILFWGFLFAFFTACRPPSPFEEKMKACMQTSLQWRNDTTGIWETAGWWNSANVLTATIRYAGVSGDQTVLPVIEAVYNQARHYPLGTDSTGVSRYCDSFINDYYDDEGWWALAWIDAYQLTGEKKYLAMAQTIFEDMTTGWSERCGGGIFWKKNPLHYKNSIANNLFSLTAARLYRATGQTAYLDWFEKNVDWYLHSGLINTDLYQIEDGLDDSCQPNRNAHYTYNQGVALAVLTEMYLQSRDRKYLDLAEQIAEATLTRRLVTENGILREMKPEIAQSNDGVQFKGIFIRHLAFLYEVTKNPLYKEFIIRNAQSIVSDNYDPSSRSFGCFWQGPFYKANAAANASALECVIEAYNLTNNTDPESPASAASLHPYPCTSRAGSTILFSFPG